ncbi:Formate-tetrahydrofolate ligase [Thermanaeromonas toyohensis ToBE]|uniref:Formate--tetrahydrofolate ligase n=1 Tax=Thermanaeromonas toyohensis ToBE TaxID=698762 RepID=A0A1W1W342_9FIRM|nr:formate--tetrahydrofolate ligase [Thermanaeromonas toyohensis]SMC00052.1 Formate-tetrahydrofolate ligase [Thermanaeromonas toyohensis ToBE]
MPWDPTQMPDWQISLEAEKNMPKPEEVPDRLGLEKDEVIPYGRLCRLDYMKILQRLKDRPDGKYIEVTAVTPTPLGEGKTTTTLGLIEGLAKRGKNAGGCIRQPSSAPTFNIKGTAAGGGNALLIPMTEFSLGLTGDINNITNAHNLMMVALTARMQHETNYTDEELAKRGLRRLNIHPKKIEQRWVMDLGAQALRNIVIGLGNEMDGVTMQSGFMVSVASELMAILAMVRDLKDLRESLGRIIVAYDRQGNPITTEDLEVAGAMCAIMRESINPTLCWTAEYQPVMVHAGPFANIAVGQSSIIGDRIGLKLFEYHCTESGFGADIGFEKFVNVKCRHSGLKPNVSVIVATVRSLKMHGGGPAVVPGRPLDEAYTKENLPLLEKGIENLLHHIGIVKKSGVKPVVCINAFPTDTEEEHRLVRRYVEQAGARCAISNHWRYGGDGALELADAVIDACREEVDFKFFYPLEMPFMQRVEVIAREVYGADGVQWLPAAEAKAKVLQEKYPDFYTMMAKTHLSLSHDPNLKGVPKGWTLPIRDVLVFAGAKFLVPLCGEIRLVPGTSSDPAFRRIDVDVETGVVKGLF